MNEVEEWLNLVRQQDYLTVSESPNKSGASPRTSKNNPFFIGRLLLQSYFTDQAVFS